MPARASIRCGRIVYAWIQDRKGFSKLRPSIILTDDSEIDPEAELVVMAITTTFADPPPENCVPWPWHPRGHPVTRLHKRSAAVVNWLASLSTRDVVGFGGDVPKNVMQIIFDKMDESGE